MESEGKPVLLGKSILVPSVQELAKDCLKKIPERYLQFDEEPPNKYLSDDLQVPIINMEALISGDENELQKLHLACQEWGFFQLIKHGISSSLLDKFKLETREFFDLPIEEKKKYWQSSTDVEGFGQAFVQTQEQKLDWADMFYLTTYPQHLRRPHLFPFLPLPYRDTLENYSVELQKLTKKILDFMANALNIDIGVGGDAFGERHQSMRMNYYPPCPQPDKTIGFTPHSDGNSLITILLQLNDTQGLQIMKDTNWVGVNPIEDAFIVNVGDVMELMSNGIYRSVMHRAVVNSSKERLSVATFHGPALENEIGPLPDLITSTTPAKFKRLTMLDYWKGFLVRPLVGKSYLDLMRITDA